MIVDLAAYESGSRVAGSLSLDEVPAWIDRQQGFLWLGLRTPTSEEMSDVCRAFGLDHLDVANLLATHRRPMVGVEGGATWLVLRTAEYDDHSEVVTLGEVSLLATDRFLITIRQGAASPLSGARHELELDHDQLREGVSAAMMAVVTAVVDSYGPALDGFEKDAVEVEGEVLSESRVRPIRRLLNLSRQVRELQLAVEAMEEPLLRLTRYRSLGWTKATLQEMRIAIGQVKRVETRTHSLTGLLAAAHSANLAQVSQHQNDDMRKISAWVAIASVPTMVAGIYGMNFDHMPELRSAFGYPIVLGIMATACVALHRAFRKRLWL